MVEGPLPFIGEVLQLPGPEADAVGHTEPAVPERRPRMRDLVGVDVEQADRVAYAGVQRLVNVLTHARHVAVAKVVHRVGQRRAGQGPQGGARRLADAAFGPHVADHRHAERQRGGRGNWHRHRRRLCRVGPLDQVAAHTLAHLGRGQRTQQVAGVPGQPVSHAVRQRGQRRAGGRGRRNHRMRRGGVGLRCIHAGRCGRSRRRRAQQHAGHLGFFARAAAKPRRKGMTVRAQHVGEGHPQILARAVQLQRQARQRRLALPCQTSMKHSEPAISSQKRLETL